jgi:dUTP pyrophosphatase
MKIMLDEGAKLPTRAHEDDAGLDLYARETLTIYTYDEMGYDVLTRRSRKLPNCASFDTGVHMEIPVGYFGKIESKSGLNMKHNIVSCGGVVDSGYTGSIVVKLYNLGTEPYTFHKGDKIAQIIIQPYLAPELEVVDELSETDRGNNGFGSTGV